MTQSYFRISKNVRLNSTHIFIIKIPSKGELRGTALDNLSDIDF